jgi:hypothetical protein
MGRPEFRMLRLPGWRSAVPWSVLSQGCWRKESSVHEIDLGYLRRPAFPHPRCLGLVEPLSYPSAWMPDGRQLTGVKNTLRIPARESGDPHCQHEELARRLPARPRRLRKEGYELRYGRRAACGARLHLHPGTMMFLAKGGQDAGSVTVMPDSPLGCRRTASSRAAGGPLGPAAERDFFARVRRTRGIPPERPCTLPLATHRAPSSPNRPHRLRHGPTGLILAFLLFDEVPGVPREPQEGQKVSYAGSTSRR